MRTNYRIPKVNIGITFSVSVIRPRIHLIRRCICRVAEAEEFSPLDLPSLKSDISTKCDGSDTLSSFDPMSEDYFSETNKLDYDKDDVSQAIYGQKLERRTLCRFYSRGRVCYKGNKCRYLHQRKTDFNSKQSSEAMVYDHQPAIPTNDMPILILITSILNPFHFWAQILPNTINPGAIEQEVEVRDPLSYLTIRMNTHYRHAGYRESKYYPAIGEIVAVRSRSGDYRRSRVTETDEEGERKCRVFHLDYGVFEVVSEDSLRVMVPDFVDELPFQAQEMMLADIKPSYHTGLKIIFVLFSFSNLVFTILIELEIRVNYDVTTT